MTAENSKATGPSLDNKTSTATLLGKSHSLNSQIRSLLLDCPSREELFEKLLQICTEQYPATVRQVDFGTGKSMQTRMTHDPRLAKSLADRFSREYLSPLAGEVRSGPEPKLKRYERGDQKMTLISAPIMNVATNGTEGAITLMLGGGTYKQDIVLSRLDAIAAVFSAVLAAKSVTVAAAASGGRARSDRAGADPRLPGTTTSSLQQTNAVARAAQYTSIREFGFSIVNSLCGQFRAEQVFFGVEVNKRINVEAVSGIAHFKASSPGIAGVRQAMEECFDLEDLTVSQQELPEGAKSPRIHRQWSVDSNNSCVCSIPLKHGDTVTGVISIRRPANRPFAKEELDKLQRSLGSYGAAIPVMLKANRSLGGQLKAAVSDSARRNLTQGSAGRKIVLAALCVGLLWFLFGTMIYRPLCRTRVTAVEMRHFSAPFDGKLQQVRVRPGQQVSQGDLLVEFDTADLRLELNGLVRQLSAAQVELRQGISEDDLSVAALARSRMNVLQTQAAAVQKQIEDARITAPADGTVVLSDLEQRIGQMFSRGEELLQFAPEGDWLLEIEVPDAIANCVAPQQTGTFAATSLPTEKQPFTISHVDGAALVVGDRNVFIARAPLEARPEWMKSGMEGMARVETVARPVWWVALHGVVDWARTNFWI